MSTPIETFRRLLALAAEDSHEGRTAAWKACAMLRGSPGRPSELAVVEAASLPKGSKGGIIDVERTVEGVVRTARHVRSAVDEVAGIARTVNEVFGPFDKSKRRRRR